MRFETIEQYNMYLDVRIVITMMCCIEFVDESSTVSTDACLEMMLECYQDYWNEYGPKIDIQ